MGELLSALLIVGILGGLIAFTIRGPEGVRRLFAGVLGRRSDEWAGAVPANVLLIAITVMLALELGIITGGAGSGIAIALIIGAAIGLAIVPNITSLVLGVAGLIWAVPQMIDDHGSGVVVPILLLSVLASVMAGILDRR